MHSSGSMTRKFGPSWKQSTGQTSTQVMYLHLMQFSVTTKVMGGSGAGRRPILAPLDRERVHREGAARAVGEEGFERQADAGERDLVPGQRRFLEQPGLERLGA